ncbi:hypothetical protein DCAR_0522567 [Daucus carota subsp. sativus]|uniref:Uncharacterized protein n=1 Tax=Daucus carota subsp. sativus TaxID=79200 RepID=A0A164ZVU7_DAUCS|nr:hypothetical protein DCAR_0522567 [Daucus carota subsp. sativus]
MGSKSFLLLALCIAFALLLSSEVAARQLAETRTTTEGGDSDGGGHYNRGVVGGRDRALEEYKPTPYKTPTCVKTCYGMCC